MDFGMQSRDGFSNFPGGSWILDLITFLVSNLSNQPPGEIKTLNFEEWARVTR